MKLAEEGENATADDSSSDAAATIVTILFILRIRWYGSRWNADD